MHCHVVKADEDFPVATSGYVNYQMQQYRSCSEAIENTHAPNEEADADLRSDYQSQREADQHGNKSIRPD